MQLAAKDFDYLGRCLEGFFFGLYSGIFALHLQIHASRKETDSRKQTIVIHALWVLYLLSVAVIALDIALFVVIAFNHNISTYHLEIAQNSLFACCDLIAQTILIHRCWIVWSCNIRVVIIPLILAFTYSVMSIADIGQFIEHGGIDSSGWGDILFLTGLTASMTLNALVTGLIVFRIFKVFREVKSITTSVEKSSGISGGRKLRSIIFVIVESGIALFAIQLARLILAPAQVSTSSKFKAYQLILGIHEMLNGITPTIILVRVSMGLSFRDEPSLVETVSNLQFAVDNTNPTMESISQDGSIDIGLDDPNEIPDMGNITQERRDDNGGSDKIRMVDR